MSSHLVHLDAWHPLPVRGRLLFRLYSALMFGTLGLLLGVPIGFLLAAHMDVLPWLPIALCELAAILFGLWFGGRAHHFHRWRLDDDGLSLCRGRLWQHEIWVPASRVQHLDIQSGPLQRRRKLANLIIHTAGSHANTIILPALDIEHAHYLHSVLAARIGQEQDVD